MPGQEIDEEVLNALYSSQIVLLLISADYLASNYCYQKEMEEALALRKENKLEVIPVMLREVDLKGTPIDHLLSLPEDRKAVTQFRNEDVAFKNVADGIRRVVEGWYQKSMPQLNAGKRIPVTNSVDKKEVLQAQYNYGFQFSGSIINGGSFEIKKE